MKLLLPDAGLNPDIKETPIDDAQKIYAEVVFGTPNRDCRGYGICKVIAFSEHDHPQPKCCSAPATLSLTTPQKLCMNFKVTHLSPKVLERYFKDDIFLIYENFSFPLWCNEFFQTEDMVIYSGKYRIDKNRKDYAIVFDVLTG